MNEYGTTIQRPITHHNTYAPSSQEDKLAVDERIGELTRQMLELEQREPEQVQHHELDNIRLALIELEQTVQGAMRHSALKQDAQKSVDASLLFNKMVLDTSRLDELHQRLDSLEHRGVEALNGRTLSAMLPTGRPAGVTWTRV